MDWESSLKSTALDGTRLHSEFIRCTKSMSYYAFQCDTCSKKEKIDYSKQEENYCFDVSEWETWDAGLGILVCRSCKLACHHGHSVKQVHVRRDLELDIVDCACIKTSKCHFLK